MDKIIYKYPLTRDELQEVYLPVGAEILTIALQGDSLYLWALVNPNPKEHEFRFFEIVPTGHIFKQDSTIHRNFMTTIQMWGGSLVYHVFERV
jgi:hypothetical protein